ncbi:MAG: pyridoxal 5'-phosphate synthase glutaminase subunit PdxT [Actinomycetes bacterium]
MKVGVLALQGAFAAHVRVLERLGAAATEVRSAAQLAEVDALVLPGGESTTISMIAQRVGLWVPLGEFVRSGRPVLGTCAGLILLSAEVLDGRDDQVSLGALDVAVRRNAFGRQLASFETDVPVEGLDGPFRAVCIRAPAVERLGDGVEVLAEVDGHPALVRQGAMMGAIFHPELADDPRLHELFLAG